MRPVLATLVTCLLFLPTAARADFSLTLEDVSPGANVTIKNGSETLPLFAGQLQMGYNSGGSHQSLYTFCVDLDHRVSVGQTYTVSAESSVDTLSPYGRNMMWLYKEHLGDKSLGSDSNTACALQLALWDLIKDGGDGLSKGDFQIVSASQDIIDLANDFIHQALSNQLDGCWLNAAPSGDDVNRGQSVIGCVETTVAPVPPTAVLAFIGLTIAGASNFLRRRPPLLLA